MAPAAATKTDCQTKAVAELDMDRSCGGQLKSEPLSVGVVLKEEQSQKESDDDAGSNRPGQQAYKATLSHPVAKPNDRSPENLSLKTPKP